MQEINKFFWNFLESCNGFQFSLNKSNLIKSTRFARWIKIRIDRKCLKKEKKIEMVSRCVK